MSGEKNRPAVIFATKDYQVLWSGGWDYEWQRKAGDGTWSKLTAEEAETVLPVAANAIHHLAAQLHHLEMRMEKVETP